MKKGFLFISLLALLTMACSKKNAEEDTPTQEVPAAPANVVLHSAAETTLTFQWNAVSNASSYSWQLTQNGSKVQEGNVTTRNVSVSNLTAGTSYRFGVQAVNTAGSSSLSWVEASTAKKKEDPDPDPPTPEGIAYEEFDIPAVEEDGIARAFPGAEGGGMYTTGGRGGKVIHVTNLNDSGEGSLRAAVNQSGARIVVFDVAGVIELQSDLKISKGDLTIAGQTAPGDGICLKNYTTNIQADNIIIRFIRFRLGDEAPWSQSDIEAGKADGEDCIWGRYHENIIIDHCSMSWSVDEGASFYGNEFFTLQWCVIAEAMRNCKLHTKGSHGYGGIWGGKNASFHHNLLAHNDSRNARIDHPHIYEDHKNPARRGNVDLRNNVIYNWGDNSTYGGEGGHFNFVGNYYKQGPSSKDRKYFVDAYGAYGSNCKTCGASNIDDGYPELHLSGNAYAQYSAMENGPAGIYWHSGEDHAHYNETVSTALTIQGKDAAEAYTTTQSAQDALTAVLSYSGASLSRDAVDERISDDVLAGSGTLIDDIASVKAQYGYAWPDYTASEEELAAVTDTDGDGIPDVVEDEWGLDKTDASDGAAISLDKNGRYTNLEMYLHYLVKDIVAGGNTNGNYKKL